MTQDDLHGRGGSHEDSRDDSRDAAIDASLRRLFDPPQQVEAPDPGPLAGDLTPAARGPRPLQAEESGRAGPTSHGAHGAHGASGTHAERPTAHALPLGGGAWGWRLGIALAASLGAFFLLVRDVEKEQLPVSGYVTGEVTRDVTANAREQRLRPVPLGLGTGTPEDGLAFRALDADELARLYVDATDEALAACSDPEEMAALQADLGGACGVELALDYDGSGLLRGPFSFAEVPTGTVLTGYPEGTAGMPSVLIAECDTDPACCVAEGIGQAGGLQVFSSRFGDLVLTEITPSGSPRLLPLFELR